MDFPYIALFPNNYSLIVSYFAPFWAGPPCRPARFFFEGPRAPYGSGRGAPGGENKPPATNVQEIVGFTRKQN